MSEEKQALAVSTSHQQQQQAKPGLGCHFQAVGHPCGIQIQLELAALSVQQDLKYKVGTSGIAWVIIGKVYGL